MRTTVHAVDGTVIKGNGVSEALRNLEFYNSLEPTKQEAKYLVCYGLGESEREFSTFVGALACYVENIDARGGAKIWNLDLCDDTTDGLIEAEREAIEAANETLTKGVA